MRDMDDDATRWDERYRDNELAEARPPDVLAEHPELLPRVPAHGRAVDIACGTGAQSLWLAGRGLAVTALDVSPVAIDLTIAAARRAGLAESITARVTDLDAGLPTDLDHVDVVICQRFRHPNLFPAIVDCLRPGGIAVVTVLSSVGLDGEPGPFHAPPGELLDAFTRDDTELLLDVESHGLASVVLTRR